MMALRRSRTDHDSRLYLDNLSRCAVACADIGTRGADFNPVCRPVLCASGACLAISAAFGLINATFSGVAIMGGLECPFKVAVQH